MQTLGAVDTSCIGIEMDGINGFDGSMTWMILMEGTGIGPDLDILMDSMDGFNIDLWWVCYDFDGDYFLC